MTREELLKKIQERFASRIKDVVDKSAKRLYMEMDAKDIKEVTRYFVVDLGARFNIASGIDTRSCIEILYHFSFDELPLILSVRVKLDRQKPVIDSITPLIKGAEWIEREMHELIGIDFVGHPNLARLLLPEDWPKGVYPLRQDYQEWDKGAIRDRGV